VSWSFHVKNGDLNFAGPGGFATVTGQQKLVQDLKNWLLEPRGTDPFHPDYGSVLDGGTLPDGTSVNSQIGNLVSGEILLNIEAEVRRILTGYQQQQLDRLNRETLLYGGKNTFNSSEILASIEDVVIQQLGDVVLVRCVLRTASGDAISFAQALT
jgi:hypothetical protein